MPACQTSASKIATDELVEGCFVVTRLYDQSSACAAWGCHKNQAWMLLSLWTYGCVSLYVTSCAFGMLDQYLAATSGTISLAPAATYSFAPPL